LRSGRNGSEWDIYYVGPSFVRWCDVEELWGEKQNRLVDHLALRLIELGMISQGIEEVMLPDSRLRRAVIGAEETSTFSRSFGEQMIVNRRDVAGTESSAFHTGDFALDGARGEVRSLFPAGPAEADDRKPSVTTSSSRVILESSGSCGQDVST
jgi:hypothetical protein